MKKLKNSRWVYYVLAFFLFVFANRLIWEFNGQDDGNLLVNAALSLFLTGLIVFADWGIRRRKDKSRDKNSR